MKFVTTICPSSKLQPSKIASDILINPAPEIAKRIKIQLFYEYLSLMSN